MKSADSREDWEISEDGRVSTVWFSESTTVFGSEVTEVKFESRTGSLETSSAKEKSC